MICKGFLGFSNGWKSVTIPRMTKQPEPTPIKTLRDAYTSPSHNLWFFECLESERQQGVESGFMFGVSLGKAGRDGLFEKIEIVVIFRVQAFLFDEFPNTLDKI